MIKLVVCDIDNTLVPKHKQMREATRNMILKLQEAGIQFGLASGRNVSGLHNLEDAWEIKCDVLIGLNGGDLYDRSDDSYHLYYRMEKPWIKEIIDIMKPFDVSISVSDESHRMASKIDDHVRASESYNKNKLPLVIPENIYDLATVNSFKVGCRMKDESQWPAIAERLSHYTFTDYLPVRTEFTMLEFCNAKAQKGTLLKVYCDKHGIDMSEVAAFGDMTNDISMLKVAGMGVCMLNGSDDAKAASNYITEKSVDEEGFVDFCEKHILNQEKQ